MIGIGVVAEFPGRSHRRARPFPPPPSFIFPGFEPWRFAMTDATVVDLATMSDAELAAEISSSGAPPIMTKDGPKSPTRKMEAAASSRKEATLRAVIRAQRDANYRADRLVRPLCLGVLRGRSSTPTQIRLATEIIRGCDVAPEDEGLLSETIRAGLAIRTGADLAPMRGDASSSSVPAVAVTGARSFAAAP